SAAVIATAPAGGCTARIRIIAVMVTPTASATHNAEFGVSMQASTPTAAAVQQPTTADQGWASGLFGTAKTNTEVAPKGASRERPSRKAVEGDIRNTPETPSPTTAPTPARSASRGEPGAMAGPSACVIWCSTAPAGLSMWVFLAPAGKRASP